MKQKVEEKPRIEVAKDNFFKEMTHRNVNEIENFIKFN